MTSPFESESEPVGSLSEEAFKLFRSLSGAHAGDEQDESHVCTTAWCPVCQVVGLVRDNPDAVVKVSQSAAAFAKSIRELIDTAVTTKGES